MDDETSNPGQGFGLPAAPIIPLELATEWVDVEHPDGLSIAETAILSRLHYIASQNQHIIMRQLENLHLTNSRAQSRRTSISSAVGSTEGGGDTSIPPIPGDRVQKAFDELRTGELQKILTTLHAPFVTINHKKLYVQRTINANTDARTFVDHVTKVIKEKQDDPEGQEADVAEHHEKMLGYLDNLTPDLKTDLYIELNKAKKKQDNPKGKAQPKAKSKGKAAESPIFVATDDSDHQSTTSRQSRSERAGGASRAGLSTAITQKQQAPTRPSRQISNTSQGSGQSRRYPSRQTSGSSRVEGGHSQQSQLSMTSVQARRSKQRTCFVIADSEDDDGDSPQD